MHIIDSVPADKMHKILKDFEIEMDYLIPARKPDHVDFAVPAVQSVKIKERKR